MTGRFFAQILSVEGIFMIPPMVIGFCLGEWNAALSFVWTFLITAGLSALLFFLCKGAPSVFRAKDGLICVGLGWILLSVVGALPFLFSKAIPKVIDAWFEIVSGFTTTGASILSEVESLPKSILYWRSFSHWLGGMGVLVFLLLFNNDKGQGFTMHLLRAESPGPNVSKLVPKMRQTAAILYGIYIVLTVLNIAFLLLGGMPLFEAVCHAFGTAGTGGFGVKNDSFASYSPYLQVVTTVFMFLFGMNFGCYHLLLLKQVRSFFRDEEIRLYILCCLGAIGLVTVNLLGTFETFGETLRHASFQVVSITSTSGFATADTNTWPAVAIVLLVVCSVICGCAGSTSGGMKVDRVLIAAKVVRNRMKIQLHPNAIIRTKVDGIVQEDSTLSLVMTFIVTYIILVLIGTVVYTLFGCDILTGFTASIACISNVGPGFGEVGSMSNFSTLPTVLKLLSTLLMLIGRLEIFGLIQLLFIRSWR